MTQLSKMDFRNQTNYNSTSNVEIKRRNNRTKRNLISRKYRIRKKKSSRYNLIFFLQELHSEQRIGRSILKPTGDISRRLNIISLRVFHRMKVSLNPETRQPPSFREGKRV